MANLTFQQLEDLWKQAGGDPVYAVMAAAVAMAESGGNPDAQHTNNNGTVDRGLWQINSIHGSQSTTDVMANARAAVSISSNGTNWRPWCTAWSNGACGGTYLGNGSPYQKFTTGDASSPSGGGGTGGTTAQTVGNPITGWTSDLAKAFLGPIGKWFWYGGVASFGVLMMIVGAIVMTHDLVGRTQTGQAIKSGLVGVASRGVVRNAGQRRRTSSGGSTGGGGTVPGVRQAENSRDTGRRPVRRGTSEGIEAVRQRRQEAAVKRRAARERARNSTGGGAHRAEA